jgi:hypothetical protein
MHEFVTQYFPGANKPPVDLAEEWVILGVVAR